MTDTTQLSSDDVAAYVTDAAPEEATDENILSRITRLAREAVAAAADVERAEMSLKAAQDRQRNLLEFLLPNAMLEAEQDDIKTSDGVRIKLTEQLFASIPAAQQEPAFDWLVANNQGAIIKRNLFLQFGKGEEQKAAEAIDALRDHGFAPTDKQSVHPQTLAKAIKEMLESGVDVPMELLGAHVRRSVKIEPPKS